MTRFDQLPSQELKTLFLQLVYHVYANPSTSTRNEMAVLEKGFMMGLRSKDTSTRERFFRIFDSSIGRSVNQRLHYIFAVQSWECLASSYWVRQALQLCLSILNDRLPLKLAPVTAHVPAVILVRKGDEDSTNDKSMDYDTTTTTEKKRKRSSSSASSSSSSEPSQALLDLLASESSFLASTTAYTNGDLIRPLSFLIHVDVNLAHQLWILIFPRIWRYLAVDQQKQLHRPITSLLSREYHLKQDAQRPNVVQAILEGISYCDPPVPMHVDLLKYLGKRFNGWHVVLRLLERQVLQALGHSAPEERAYNALAEMYTLLSEDDLFYGLWRRRATLADTVLGLVYEQHGFWQRAQDVYYRAMSRDQAGQLKPPPPSAESRLWELHWVRCAKRANQWDLLVDYARTDNQPDLLLQCAWKVNDWASMADTLEKRSFAPNPLIKIYQAYVAVNENRPGDVEPLFSQAVQAALQQWASLPDMPMSSRVPLLQRFQNIVEVSESAKVITEMHSTNHRPMAVGELKGVLGVWRDRLPNKWEDIVVWNDVIMWRLHVFTLVNKAFEPLLNSNGQPAYAHTGHHETAWAISKFAHVARQHRMEEVCLTSLSKIYKLPNIEIQDAFSKLVDQVKCYLQLPPTANHYRTGVDIINSTNLDYFGDQYKVEFFRLKGEFLANMDKVDAANTCFHTAVTIYDEHGRSWISWGEFLDKQAQKHRASSISAGQDAAGQDPSSSALVLAARSDSDARAQTCAVDAVDCYMQGVHRDHDRGHRVLARVLWLLSCEDDTGALGIAFDKYTLPAWLWIAWIPQLLASLARPEAPRMLKVLRTLAERFPQALFYTLRSFILEQREKPSPPCPATPSTTATSATTTSTAAATPAGIVQSSSSSSSSQPGTPVSQPGTPSATAGDVEMAEAVPPQTAYQMATEVMEVIRVSHGSLMARMESLVTEIGRVMQPFPEEQLLDAVASLLTTCYRNENFVGGNMPKPLARQATLLTRFSFLLNPTEMHALPSRRHSWDVRRAAFIADFKRLGVPDCRVGSLIDFLTGWVERLQGYVATLPLKLSLRDLSPNLFNSPPATVEVPGQYTGDGEPEHDMHATFDRVVAHVRRQRKRGFSQRMFTIRGSNGNRFPFFAELRQQQETRPALRDQRMNQILSLVNHIASRQRETRRRDIYVNVPTVIPFSPRLRLVQAKKDYVSLLEVLEQYCVARRQTLETSLQFYREKIIKEYQAAADAGREKKVTRDMQKSVVQEICRNVVPSNILKNFVYISIAPSSTYSQLFAFRNKFNAQLAVSSLLGYVFGIGNRSPQNILFSLQSGAAFQLEFYPMYNDRGALARRDAVPFRLTPNIRAFFNPIGIEGLFNACMTAGAMCLAEYRQELLDVVRMFLRDEMLWWHSTKSQAALASAPSGSASASLSSADVPAPPPPPAPVPMAMDDLKRLVKSNTNVIAVRVDALAPPQSVHTHEKTPPPVTAMNCKVTELIRVAEGASGISIMDPTWLPWF